MKILIIGGSGILSSDFTKKSLDEGNQVIVVNRGKRQEFLDTRATHIATDIRKENTQYLKQRINIYDYDVVVDFLSYEPNHLEKMLNVLDGNFNQYVFISSATIYRENQGIISESKEIGNEKWDYAYKKYLCECFLKFQKDINYTIIRPYITYGNLRIPFQIIPDLYHFSLIARIKEKKPVLLFEEGNAVCTLTHTIDFAEILYKLLLNAKAYGEEFHITSTEHHSWKEVYIMICNILNVTPNYFSVDKKTTKKYLPEYYDMLQGDKGRDMVFDNKKVLEAIGTYKFKMPLYEGLTSSIQYFEQHKNMQGIDYKWDGRIDYLLKKCDYKNKQFLKHIKTNNNCSNNLLLYYIMQYKPLRFLYMLLKRYHYM